MNYAKIISAVALSLSCVTPLAGCDGGPNNDSSSSASRELSAAEQAHVDDLLTRWNAIAQDVRAKTPSAADLDFEWTPTAFPAPTFRGGSMEAYETFATILVQFYATGDNLQFAESNGLLTMSFSDGLDPAHGGTSYSLAEMTAELSGGSYVGSLVTTETANKLKAYCPDVGCDDAP